MSSTSLPPLLQATSGAIGSAVGNAIVFPLDLATTRIQHTPRRTAKQKVTIIRSLQRLVKRRGLSGLYPGLGADTISTIASSFLYFLFYTSLQKGVLRRRRRPLLSTPSAKSGDIPPLQSISALEELAIGVVAGIASKGVTLPISTVCVRQQLGDNDDHHRPTLSLLETLRAIQRETGITGLFAGFRASIPLALLPSLSLYIHHVLLRSLVPPRLHDHPPGSVTFLLGAASNALASLPLYPLILVKSLGQAGKGGLEGTWEDILRRDGLPGLYKGIEAQLIKGFVQQGVMMLMKQRIEEVAVQAYRSLLL